jgi:hypothetical protein
MNGLVSTGKKIPYTILKRILSLIKKNPNFFMHIDKQNVEKQQAFCTSNIHFALAVYLLK